MSQCPFRHEKSCCAKIPCWEPSGDPLRLGTFITKKRNTLLLNPGKELFCPSCPLRGRKEHICLCETGREIGNPAAEKRTGFVQQRQRHQAALFASGGPQRLAQRPHHGKHPWGSCPLHYHPRVSTRHTQPHKALVPPRGLTQPTLCPHSLPWPPLPGLLIPTPELPP